ncbi:hypothetical protein [Glacieibacterium frigidum]|uniref:Lipoprotein n=1 Tax=Glacieibacterium frigidum TaxID=2593303 RepID=A0A552U7D8_9SPHN|nr:hypothetical protein [Glacieibacterium frigidum]TRW14130.1 hypothetical protein FMM06_10395 [Glacieibacterium frigidum]
MRLLPLIIALPLLAACSVKADSDAKKAEVSIGGVEIDADGEKATVSVGGESGMKIETDGFKAALDIPGMDIGGKDFDIDGMKLYPGSVVKGMAVNATGKGDAKTSTVKVTFTSPAAPDAVLAHTEAEAKREGFTATRSGLGLTGSDGKDKSIQVRVAAAGKGSTGTLTLTDAKAG